jgi:undecaprenyl-diphosphatase
LIFIFLILVIIIWFYKKPLSENIDNKRIFMLSVFSSVISWLIIDKLLGAIYYENRPFVILKHVNLLFHYTANNSFPSDHSAVTMALASMIFIYNKKLGWGFIFLSILIGFSRVFSGVHYPDDIIVGFLSVILSTYIIYLLRHKLESIMKIGINIAEKIHLG